MKKSELKAIIRECIEERRGHGVRPVNPRIKKDIDTYSNMQDPDYSPSDRKKAEHVEDRVYNRGVRGGYEKNMTKAGDIRHFGRDNHTRGIDPLTRKQWPFSSKKRVTKSGKMNKQDVKGMKSRAKDDLKYGDKTKPKLPK